MRLEPIILELEREQNDLLIIAHESVLRVLYSYLMHCSTRDIPKLKFPRDEIIEIIPAAYQNEAKRIHIPGLDPRMIPGSPEDIRIPVPPGFDDFGKQLSPISIPAMMMGTPPSATEVTVGFATGDRKGSISVSNTGGLRSVSGSFSGGERPVTEKIVNNTAKEMVEDKVEDED